MAKVLGYGLLGVAVLLLLKFGVVGVCKWNRVWHPGRVENKAGC